MRPLSPALLTAILLTFSVCLAVNVDASSRAPSYDEVTLSALRDYFQTFSAADKP